MGNKKNRHFGQKMVETLELPKDLFFGAAIVTVTGREEIIIENYKGILEYTGECIKLQTKECRLILHGCGLNIAYYTNDEMKVTGLIQSILYEA